MDNHPISIRPDVATRAALDALHTRERDAVARGDTARASSQNAIICNAICEKAARLEAKQPIKARRKPRGKESK